MFASSHGSISAVRRRGIVLVLVLGMLGLMALIGVTFATFAGQSLKNGRNFSQGVARPQPEALMDFALAQLIQDTSNPLSAIRGHSLLRDMYGNDSVFRLGNNPAANYIAETGGVMTRVYDPTIPGYTTLHLGTPTTLGNGLNQYQTNIPTTGQYSGYDFTRWILRCAPGNPGVVPQTFEVITDNYSGTYHVFTLAANLGLAHPDANYGGSTQFSSDSTAFTFSDPNIGAASSGTGLSKAFTALSREVGTGTIPFTLDGRYMRAFNGPGLTRPVLAVNATDATGSNNITDSNGNTLTNYPFNQAAYGNMRIIGADPDTIGMDEDYDACDLENWFLAIQSADGQVMVPSFHRPGILTSLDWSVPATNSSNGQPINQTTRSKILRPRQTDNSPLFPADPSVVDTTTGKLTYDIDNDGDGVTDSVWLDLGYPVQRDPNGKLYKPLFAFMVLGLNGRLPLNTVGNLQARAIGDTTNNTTNGYSASTGQVPYPGPNNTFSSQVYFDTPLYDHASHLGYSVNEINPKFALQNAPSNLYGSSDAYGTSYSQHDNSYVNVALTQLRNILAGTIPTDLPTPYLGSTSYSPNTTYATYRPANPVSYNDDMNGVLVNNQWWILPNNVADNNDVITNGNPVVRPMLPVPGRWGEPAGIPATLTLPTSFIDSVQAGSYGPMYRYTNLVRAGRSAFLATLGTNDVMDDDFDAYDPYLPYQLTNQNELPSTGFEIVQNGTSPTNYHLPVNSTAATNTFYRTSPEFLDRFDLAGQIAIASERARRYVTPQDPVGVGRMVSFTTRPARDHDYGYGFDSHGRSSYFRYFRPAGMPQQVFYPYADSSNSGFGFVYHTTTPNALGQPYTGLGQQYLAPVLIPAGYSAPVAGQPTTSQEDLFNNVLHGYQAMLTPDTQASAQNAGFTGVDSLYTAPEVATMAAMPYDHDAVAGATPAGYVETPNASGVAIPLVAPLINPTPLNNAPVLSNIGTETGPNLGAIGAGGTYMVGGNSQTYPIPYVPGANNSDLTAGTYTAGVPSYPMVVNGYLGGSLNKDEADEMNLYAPNSHDMPYGPTDLEWLYRKHDVDGATLNSRLAQLAPVSFLNPADGLTRRRLFSTDSWDLINFSYANDNPIPYAGVVGFTTPYSRHSSDHDFSYNSRFMPFGSASLAQINYVPNITPASSSYTNPTPPYYDPNSTFNYDANPVTTEFLPNPTAINYSPPTAISSTTQNKTDSPPSSLYNMYSAATTHVAVVQTPTVAHRDRKINLNYPLPISNDPAEPIRQKWCRETYRLLKAILPPASVDTPEELAGLSQFVVNIVDFRDTDCTTTRFVNTDLIVTDALTKANLATTANTTAFNASPQGVRFADPANNAADTVPTGNFPYDPSLYSPDATTQYLVQHGMEYNPIAINEVFAMQYKCNTASNTMPGQPSTTTQDQTLNGVTRGLFIEMVNTLTEAQNFSLDSSSNPSLTNASAVDLTGWDLIITPDDYGWGRPDPITGEVTQVAWPPQPTTGNTTFVDPPVYFGTASANTTLPTGATVQQYRFNSETTNAANSGSNNRVRAINGTRVRDYYIAGAYTYNETPPTAPAAGTAPTVATAGQMWPIGGSDSQNGGTATTVANNKTVESSPIVCSTTKRSPDNDAGDRGATPTTFPTLDVVLPQSFIPYYSPTSSTNAVTAASGKGAYFWVYLRRPANPFDIADLSTTRPNREMVVVDAMRFAYSDIGTVGTINTQTDVPNTNTNNDIAFSSQRLQPHRGGHLVPNNTPVANTPSASIIPPTPAGAWGYSEQTVPPNQPTGTNADSVRYVNKNGAGVIAPPLYGKPFYETIGRANDQVDTNWAPLPFHDRDFANVAELLLVPNCPPGLFTKQFVEEPYPGHAAGYTITNQKITFNSTTTGNTTTVTASPGPPGTSTTTPAAAGWDRRNLNSVTTPPAEPEVGRVDFGYQNLPAAPTYPYLTDNFYYTAASVAPPLDNSLNAGYTHLTTEVGGWTGTGWHKMMEFFEVPSSANGAIGTAENGVNYDWYRADIKPGLVNLNLLIDEEVFAGVLDDPRLNENLAVATVGTTIPYVVSQIDVNGYPAVISTSPTNYARSPMFSGSSYNIPAGSQATGRGYVIRDPNLADYAGNAAFTPQYVHGLKAAFSDFLKIRHGGSGHLYAHGAGDVGMGDWNLLPSGTTTTQPIAADRPFRSLSYPDINYTIMRPATLPPTPVDTNPTVHYPGTVPPLTLIDAYTNHVLTGGLFVYGVNSASPWVSLNPATLTPPYLQDPGIRNPFLDIQYNTTTTRPPYDVTPYNVGTAPAGAMPAPFPPTIPPTPARRLFQVPDFGQTEINDQTASPTTVKQYPTSNASLATQTTFDSSGNPIPIYMVNQPVLTPQLWTGGLPTPTGPPSLVPPYRAVFAANNLTPQAAVQTDDTHANNYLGEGSVGEAPTAAPYDLRQHPAYRTEMIQKIGNLTTVRTHQFAVWITVGFFEVVKPGTPELGLPDVLGQEVGSGAGNEVRYRSFFVVDRTKATGFNPYYPGNFRDCVTYRRRIE